MVCTAVENKERTAKTQRRKGAKVLVSWRLGFLRFGGAKSFVMPGAIGNQAYSLQPVGQEIADETTTFNSADIRTPMPRFMPQTGRRSRRQTPAIINERK